MTTKETWQPLGRPSGADHHRYFQRLDDGRVSVADNSGTDPDRTDDGPLYLDTARSARIELSGLTGAVCVRLPVRTQTGARVNCHVQPGDLVFLLHAGHWRAAAVEVSEEIEPLIDLFFSLLR